MHEVYQSRFALPYYYTMSVTHDQMMIKQQQKKTPPCKMVSLYRESLANLYLVLYPDPLNAADITATRSGDVIHRIVGLGTRINTKGG